MSITNTLTNTKNGKVDVPDMIKLIAELYTKNLDEFEEGLKRFEGVIDAMEASQRELGDTSRIREHLEQYRVICSDCRRYIGSIQ